MNRSFPDGKMTGRHSETWWKARAKHRGPEQHWVWACRPGTGRSPPGRSTETCASIHRDPGLRGLRSVLVKTMMVRRTMMTEKEEKEAESPSSRRSRRSNGRRSRRKCNGCCCRPACSHLRTVAQAVPSARSAPAQVTMWISLTVPRSLSNAFDQRDLSCPTDPKQLHPQDCMFPLCFFLQHRCPPDILHISSFISLCYSHPTSSGTVLFTAPSQGS